MEALPERFGKYHVLERLARGGMAEIYRVKTIGIAGFEKVQALKRILPAFAKQPRFIRSFIDEARIAVELNHRNIVQVFDFGKADGELYLAMELIDGVDLRTAIRDAARKRMELPIGLSCHVLREVGAGLDYAHRKAGLDRQPLNIVHCDVSPQNIVLSHEGFVKILDFGVARARIGTAPQGKRLRGKPRYMAPEQTRGEQPTAATDVFSLAIIGWELLTGLPLFEGKDIAAILKAVRRADVPAVHKLNQDVPTALSDAITTALSPEPEARGTAAQLAAAFASATQTLGGIASRDLAEWLRLVYPPADIDDTGVTAIEVPPPRARTDELTMDTRTLSRVLLLEEIDEVQEVHHLVALSDRRRVVAVVAVIDGDDAKRREMIQILSDLAYKRGAVVHETDHESFVVVFGLDVAGEDNVARAMGYALDVIEVAREAAVAGGDVSVRIAARAGVVAKRWGDGYHLIGDAVAEARSLALDAEPSRPLLTGGAGRAASAWYSFRELPARRLRRRRLRVLELVGPRSFDERHRALHARRGRFFGRQRSLARLARQLTTAIRENRRVTSIVVGGAGVGKSRLVAEFVARATAAAALTPQLVAVAATPAGEVAPFSVVTELFQTALNLPPGRGESARAQLALRLRHVFTQGGLARDEVDEAVGTLELAMELRDGQVFGRAHTSTDLRERLAAALRMFRRVLMVDDRPLITVIEDMHFADAASADVFRTLLGDIDEEGAELLLLTVRSEHQERLDDLPDHESVVIEELVSEHRDALIRDRLADTASAETVHAVARRAGGNPLFIEEVAEAVRERGTTDIPGSVREVIVARVDRLAPSVKATLQYAAVVGRSVRGRILEELVGTELHAELEELCAEGMLRRSDSAAPEASEGELQFAHGLLQEVVYDSLGAAARKETHALLGNLLLSRYQAGREEPPATIAHHLELGADPGAAAYWLRAGRVALAAFDATGAVEYFTRTLELEDQRLDMEGRASSASRARRREALSGRERAYFQLGAHEDEARDLADLARMLASEPRRMADIENRAATRHLRLGEYSKAVAATQRADAMARDGGDERARGEALRIRGEAYERQGEFSDALDAVARALDIFRRIGATAEETSAMVGRGRILVVRSRFEEARVAYAPVLDRIRDGGDPWLERIVCNHIAIIHMCLGDYARAYSAANRSLFICRRYGDRARAGDNLSVCGIILYEIGRFDEARRYFEQALASLERTGSRWSRADCLVYAGQNDAALGDVDAGLACIERAHAEAREIGATYVEVNAQAARAAILLGRGGPGDAARAQRLAGGAADSARAATLVSPEIQALSREAEAHFRQDRLDEAVALSSRAMHLLHQQRHIEGSEEEILYRHFRLLRAAGDDGAETVLKQARDNLDRKAKSLRNPDWLRAYFAVPLHAAIMDVT